MAAKLSNTSTSLKFMVSLIGLVANQSLVAAEELSYATATEELRRYCIAEICLGESIDRISKIGKLSFSELGLPDGKLSCAAYTYGNRAFGDFVAKSGQLFLVDFALVSTRGDPVSRYRLMSVTIWLPKVSELQLDHLRQTLTTRYNLRKIGEPEMNMWHGKAKSGKFWITATKWWSTPMDEQQRTKGLNLSAKLIQEKAWLMKQPECQTGLPKI